MEERIQPSPLDHFCALRAILKGARPRARPTVGPLETCSSKGKLGKHRAQETG